MNFFQVVVGRRHVDAEQLRHALLIEPKRVGLANSFPRFSR